jgi:hypothetical protein
MPTLPLIAWDNDVFLGSGRTQSLQRIETDKRMVNRTQEAGHGILWKSLQSKSERVKRPFECLSIDNDRPRQTEFNQLGLNQGGSNHNDWREACLTQPACQGEKSGLSVYGHQRFGLLHAFGRSGRNDDGSNRHENQVHFIEIAEMVHFR